MNKKIRLKVIKQIKSPYGIFANVDDEITYSNRMVTTKHNLSMVLPDYKKYTKKINIFQRLKNLI